ncbi:MAG: hypothetical protein ACJAZ0_002436 [Halioglobus sp.]|jgi:hypothetical protein
MSYAKAPRHRFAARFGLIVVLAVGILMSVPWGWWDGEEAAEAVPDAKLTSQLPLQLPEPESPAESGNDLSDPAQIVSVVSPLEGVEPQNEPPLSQVTEAGLDLNTFPAESLELIKISIADTIAKNYTNAALAMLDAIELSSDNPEKHVYLHQLAGWNYEQAGLVDFAIEQYRLAIAINPVERSSNEGLRRLDSEFRASHDPLSDPTPAKTSAVRDIPSPQFHD